MKTYRRGIMRVSRILLDDAVPPAPETECLECHLRKWGLNKLRAALMLPGNCTILATSLHVYFTAEVILLKLECPDFPETKDGQAMPEVEAFYKSIDGKPYFSHWCCGGVDLDSTDPAVVVKLAEVHAKWMADNADVQIQAGPTAQSWRDRDPLL